MDPLIDVMMAAEKLKSVIRTGWKLSGIELPESVADHTFGVVFLSMLLGDKLALNTERMMKMALIHDIAESKLGDIHYESKTYIGEDSLEKAEGTAARDILPDEYFELWDEYKKKETREARIVSACDKLELYFQAVHYEKTGYTDLDKFWENPWNQKDFSPEICNLFETLRKLRCKD
ncbi:MAG: HD domain-containing protein [Theionarchaea archaeon]|nr:HD domain-containing protein [Theionarchaea archaeon]